MRWLKTGRSELDTTRHLIFSCEHASAAVPARYRAADIPAAVRRSHRGWDPGAAGVAQALAQHFAAPLREGRLSRLLIDLNRSPGHPARCSEFSRGLPAALRQTLEDEYAAYRDTVAAWVRQNPPALHLSIHSFSPALDPVRRDFDLGLLYDPARRDERELAATWQAALRRRGWRVRRNAPYRGTADGLTTALRREFSAEDYAGLEVEISQGLAPQPLRRLGRDLATTLPGLN